jgi:hypothetical protein
MLHDTKDQEMNSHLIAAHLVRIWNARCPDEFQGVNVKALISHLATVHATGGVKALTEETGLRRTAVISFLQTACN